MTTILKAALNEKELIEFENEDLQELIDDLELPEVTRAMADIRLALHQQNLLMLDTIIQKQLDKIPVEDFLHEINSTTCKISR